MSNLTLLIDLNAIGYAAQSATKLSSGAQDTQAAYGMVRAMLQLRKEYPRSNMLGLWDGRADWRFKLCPEYKSNRKDTPEKRAIKASYASQKPFIERLLCHLGVPQMTAFEAEADDMAGYFVRQLTSRGVNVGLITGDGDWKQLVRRNVFWRDIRDDNRYIDANNFYDKTGCKTPLAFLETKVLTGDTSDCISGVGGIGEKGAPEFIAEFGSTRNFWHQVDSGLFVPRLKKHINLASPEGRTIFTRNFQLMQLLRVAAPKQDTVKINKGKFDKEQFANVCEELAFGSILRNLDEFQQYFS